MDEFHCVWRWQDEADLANISEIKEPWLNQFGNMQTGIRFLHFPTQALHDYSESLEIIEPLVQHG